MYVVWFHHPGSVLCKQQDNWSALLNAAKEGHHDIVTLLLEHGAEVDHKDIVRCHTQSKYLAEDDTIFFVYVLSFVT